MKESRHLIDRASTRTPQLQSHGHPRPRNSLLTPPIEVLHPILAPYFKDPDLGLGFRISGVCDACQYCNSNENYTTYPCPVTKLFTPTAILPEVHFVPACYTARTWLCTVKLGSARSRRVYRHTFVRVPPCRPTSTSSLGHASQAHVHMTRSTIYKTIVTTPLTPLQGTETRSSKMHAHSS